MLAIVDDDEEDDNGGYDEFCSDYGLDDYGIFHNVNIDDGEGFVWMTVTDSWDPSQPDEYKDDDILLPYGVFDVGNNPSIHPNFFKGVLNDSLGRLYNNDAPITPTQTFHHALLKFLMRKKRGNLDKFIEHYDALRCKLQQIGIHNSIDYFNLDGTKSLRLLLLNNDLKMVNQSTIDSINLELIYAQQIRQVKYHGSTIEEVCNIDTDLYNEELNRNGNDNLIRMLLQLANLQQKSFPNKWTNDVMRKLTIAGTKSPPELKYFVVSEMLNPHLTASGDNGLHLTMQKGFLKLINGEQDFC